MNRFFVPRDNVLGDLIIISGSDVNHIKNVLRKDRGHRIICFDSSGNEYLAEIKDISKEKISLAVISKKKNSAEPKTKITLGQSLPKLSKMDLVIQKATELGVFEIIPVISERSVPKSGKPERWNKIAKESSQQSGRTHIPGVIMPVGLPDFFKKTKDAGLKLIPFEGEDYTTIKHVLNKNAGISNIALLIGPEGGFSNSEIELAKRSGFTSVSLGKTILRTETAALAAISMILYGLEMDG
ncbi:MAG: 16S rRNA (uracil(1498)-N(3))-methyltransferase [Candidatus Saganbacteria bacterium]|nr:16S rRNA (uracil(1498)-N(3))-methyltransferase [Candidatus Saganbacteria bacterium]